MSVLVKITERAGKFRVAFIVIAIAAAVASTVIGMTAYNNARQTPVENPKQNEQGQWELTFYVKDTAYIHYFTEFYMSRAGKNDWSDNMLETPLESGKQKQYVIAIEDPSYVYYDLRALRSDGVELDFFNVDLSDTGLIVPLYDDTQFVRQDKFTVEEKRVEG